MAPHSTLFIWYTRVVNSSKYVELILRRDSIWETIIIYKNKKLSKKINVIILIKVILCLEVGS